MNLRKLSSLVVVVLVVTSAYMIFQCANVVAYNNFSRNIIVATGILDIKLLDVSPATLNKGYFTSQLTFENPSNQILNMTKLEAAYFQAIGTGSGRIAYAETWESIKLGPGETEVILQMDLSGDFSLAQPSYWIVGYRLKFGTAHYSFTFEMHDSVVTTKGPFSIWENQAHTLIFTYTLFAVDAWAVGLEVIAVLILVQERKINKTLHTSEVDYHNKMLAIIYGFQGVGIFSSLSFSAWINAIISEPPPEFFYVSGAGWVMGEILRGLVYIVSLIFLVTALGFLLRHSAARSLALVLSAIGVFVWLFGGVFVLTRPTEAQDLALAILFFVTTFANGLAIFSLLTHEAQAKQPP